MSFNTILDIIKTNQAKTLDSEMEIEDCISYINEIDKRTDFLSVLKKKRAKDIDDQVESLEKRKSILKETIASTLKANDHKSLSFPGIGRVAIKTSPDKYIVEDETALLGFLKKELTQDELNKVVEPKIIKTELNKMIKVWETTSKLPDGVKKEDGKESLSVTIDKKIDDICENKKDTDVVDAINGLDQSGFDNLGDAGI
jgi:hypothetical protein